MLKVPSLKNSQFDLKELNNFLHKSNGIELNNLHNACYKPTMVKYQTYLVKLTGIEKPDIDLFFLHLTSAYKAEFNILKNDITSIIIIGILYYSRLKQYEIVQSLFILLAIRFYTNRFSKHWNKYCKEDYWNIALKNISSKHLFKVHNGISSSMLYIASHEYRNNKTRLESPRLSDKEFIDIIYRLRHRVAQSVRSFANRYYDIENEIKPENEQKLKTEQNININLIANQISDKICTYSQIDIKSLNDAIQRSRIRKDLAIPIIQSISKVEYKDNIRLIIILMSKVINIVDICTRNQYLVRKIVMNNTKINNYSIKQEILDMTNTTMLPELKLMNKDQLTILIATYITNYIKTNIC